MTLDLDGWLGVIAAIGGVFAFLGWIQYTLNRIMDRQQDIMTAIRDAVEKPSESTLKTLEALNEIIRAIRAVGEAVNEGARENRNDHRKFLETFTRMDERDRIGGRKP